MCTEQIARGPRPSKLNAHANANANASTNAIAMAPCESLGARL